MALLAISSFGTLSFFFSNTVPPENSLIAIIFIHRKSIMLYWNSGEWRLGRGGGVVVVVSGSTEFCTLSCSPEAAVPCRDRISWNTISEFNKF